MSPGPNAGLVAGGARGARAPVKGLTHVLAAPQETPLQALWPIRQGWLVGVTMLALSATWTAVVTFLPTLLLEQRGIPPGQSGPLLGCLYYGLIPCALLGGVLEGESSAARSSSGCPRSVICSLASC